MLTIVKSKEFLSANVDALVNYVNCKGDALNEDGKVIFEKYPEMYTKYKNWCDNGKFKPGTVWYFKGSHKKAILNAALIENDEYLTLDSFRTILSKILTTVLDKDINSFAISIPIIESEAFVAKDLIEEYFYNEDVNVEVYGFEELQMIIDTIEEPVKIEVPIEDEIDEQTDTAEDPVKSKEDFVVEAGPIKIHIDEEIVKELIERPVLESTNFDGKDINLKFIGVEEPVKIEVPIEDETDEQTNEVTNEQTKLDNTSEKLETQNKSTNDANEIPFEKLEAPKLHNEYENIKQTQFVKPINKPIITPRSFPQDTFFHI